MFDGDEIDITLAVLSDGTYQPVPENPTLQAAGNYLLSAVFMCPYHKTALVLKMVTSEREVKQVGGFMLSSTGHVRPVFLCPECEGVEWWRNFDFSVDQEPMQHRLTLGQ